MGKEHKWFSFGRMMTTLGLLLLLAVVVFVEQSLFISGPSLRYDDKITTQQEVIVQKYPQITQLHRHVFAYVIYSGQDDENYYWFNENGELLTQRKLTQIHLDSALEKANLQDGTIAIGYGYKNPVYVIENEEIELYLDLDTMDQVFYRKKVAGV